MNKAELIQGLADSTAMKKTEIDSILSNLAVAVSATLKRGDEIILPGIGKLTAVKREARTSRNPNTGAPVSVPEKMIVKFKAAKDLSDRVAQG